jgi:signal transduction histidine kinase
MKALNEIMNEQLLAELQRRLDQHSDLRQEEECTRLEEEVRRLSNLLRASEHGKSQFLSNVRNEINNPLTSILGLANSISGLKVEEKVKHISRMIHQQAFELDFQMRNIIVAAEIEMGEIKPMGSRVDIVSLIEDQIGYLKSKINHAHVTVKLLAPDLLKFRTDPYLLQTICLNLFTNAIEYSGANKVVMIDVCEKGGNLHIEFVDFGAGIDFEKQKIVFERFQQVETGLTKSHPGHGLGLTIVHELVEILNGKMDLRSCPGQGTSAKIQIPPLFADDGATGISNFGNELIFSESQEY